MRTIVTGVLGFAVGVLTTLHTPFLASLSPHKASAPNQDQARSDAAPINSANGDSLSASEHEALKIQHTDELISNQRVIFLKAWKAASSRNLTSYQIKQQVEELGKITPTCEVFVYEQSTAAEKQHAERCLRKTLNELWASPDDQLKALLLSRVLTYNYSYFSSIVESEFDKLLAFFDVKQYAIEFEQLYLAQSILGKNLDIDAFGKHRYLKMQDNDEHFLRRLALTFKFNKIFNDPDAFVAALLDTWATISRTDAYFDDAYVENMHAEAASTFIWRLKSEQKDFQQQVRARLPERFSAYLDAERRRDEIFKEKIDYQRMPASEFDAFTRKRDELTATKDRLWRALIQQGL